MHFIKNDEWDWKGNQAVLVPDQVTKLQLKEDELVDDAPVRGKRHFLRFIRDAMLQC